MDSLSRLLLEPIDLSGEVLNEKLTEYEVFLGKMNDLTIPSTHSTSKIGPRPTRPAPDPRTYVHPSKRDKGKEPMDPSALVVYHCET